MPLRALSSTRALSAHSIITRARRFQTAELENGACRIANWRLRLPGCRCWIQQPAAGIQYQV